MPEDRIFVNRAPVLTLWAAVVAERLGFAWEEALSLGKAVAGLNAQSKGRALGIYQPRPKEARKQKRGEEFWIEICGRSVPAKNTEDGVRAVSGDKPIEPTSVQRYLSQKFGQDLKLTREAMEALATALDRESLATSAFSLYERFRPQIPGGKRGWGAKGILDLGLIRSLGSKA